MADILIKNMEMPTGNDDVKLIINSDGSVHRIIGWAISEKMNATAIPVPEHGDLIERDGLIDITQLGRIEATGQVVFYLTKEDIENAPVVLEAST